MKNKSRPDMPGQKVVNIKRKKSRQIEKNLVAYSFIAPNVLGFLLFTMFPVIFTLLLSLFDWDYLAGFSGLEFNGFSHYIRMWSDKWFLDSLRNNFVYSFVSVPLTIFFAFFLAVLVESFIKWKNAIRLCLFIPYITNSVVVCYVWEMMLSRNGIITQVIRFFGVSNPPMWLGSPVWALPALIMISIWINIGYVFVLYLAGLKNIPDSLYEAATIDGANWLQKVRNVTVPMVSPTTFFILITQLIFSFRVFAQINILTQGGPGTSTSVLSFYIYLLAFRFYRMGYASAITWVMFIIIFTFTLIQWKGQKKWSNIY